MKTAFDISNNTTVIIEYDEFPIKESNSTGRFDFKYADKSSGLVAMKNIITNITLIIKSDGGKDARLLSLSFSDIKKIFETSTAIKEELIPPGHVSCFDDY